MTQKAYSLTIGWLYPDLMSTYGDRGNVVTLTKRSEWREIETTVKELSLNSTPNDLEDCDLIFMGGAQDRQQEIVSEDFEKGKAKKLAAMIENNIPGLYICGAYQFLGNYYKEADGTKIPGLGLFDLYTENPGQNVSRLIGNTAVTLSFTDELKDIILVGFENHGGRTYLGKNVMPLGKVLKGFGNNGEDQTEGAVYKNSIGSYFHGPILPKNPALADFLITKALERKYNKKIILEKLNDELEQKAHDVIVRRLNIGV